MIWRDTQWAEFAIQKQILAHPPCNRLLRLRVLNKIANEARVLARMCVETDYIGVDQEHLPFADANTPSIELAVKGTDDQST